MKTDSKYNLLQKQQFANKFCIYIYIYIYIYTTPQAFWQSSAPGVLSTLVTSVVLYVKTIEPPTRFVEKYGKYNFGNRVCEIIVTLVTGKEFLVQICLVIIIYSYEDH